MPSCGWYVRYGGGTHLPSGAITYSGGSGAPAMLCKQPHGKGQLPRNPACAQTAMDGNKNMLLLRQPLGLPRPRYAGWAGRGLFLKSNNPNLSGRGKVCCVLSCYDLACSVLLCCLLFWHAMFWYDMFTHALLCHAAMFCYATCVLLCSVL